MTQANMQRKSRIATTKSVILQQTEVRPEDKSFVTIEGVRKEMKMKGIVMLEDVRAMARWVAQQTTPWQYLGMMDGWSVKGCQREVFDGLNEMWR